MRIGSRSTRVLLAGMLSLGCLIQAHAALTSEAPATPSGAASAGPSLAPPAKAFSVKTAVPTAPAPPASGPGNKPPAATTPAPAAVNPKPVAAHHALDPGQTWIKPYPGSSQTARSIRGFDEYWMPIGKLVGDAQADKAVQLEGRWIHGGYATSAGPSVAEVFRHYENEVAKAGFEVVYACKGVECGEGGRKTNGDWWALSENRRYLAARIERPAGDVWVSVHVYARGPTAPTQHEIDVVETKPPVVPPPPRNEADPATLAKELKADGRVVLRGIEFTEGRPAVLPHCEPVVQAIAELFARDPALKLYVVVHGDDTVPWSTGMDLTKKRAQAVSALLTRKFGVASARLHPAGVGPLAPVASNATEEGRSLNRRVELVPQGGSRSAGPAAAARR